YSETASRLSSTYFLRELPRSIYCGTATISPITRTLRLPGPQGWQPRFRCIACHMVRGKPRQACSTRGMPEYPQPNKSVDESQVSIDAGSVASKTEAGVTTISFSHPKSNSLPGKLLAALATSVEIAAVDPATTVIVICSEGKSAFCAGASFDELKAVTDAESGKKFFMGFARLIITM